MGNYFNKTNQDTYQAIGNEKKRSAQRSAERSTRRSQVFNAGLLVIPKNTVVYQSAWDELYDAAVVTLADVDNPSHLPVFGIVDADIQPSHLGWVTEEGLFEYGDTYHWDVRDLLFMSHEPGDITADTVSRQLFGYVVYKHRIAGKIYVTGTKKLHDTGELDGRHPVRGTDPVNASDLTTGTSPEDALLIADGTGGSDWRIDWVHDVTMTGSLTGSVFTLNYNLVEASTFLFLRGRILKPGVHFTVVDSTLTMLNPTTPFRFTDPPAVASYDNFFVHSGRIAA